MAGELLVGRRLAPGKQPGLVAAQLGVERVEFGEFCGFDKLERVGRVQQALARCAFQERVLCAESLCALLQFLHAFERRRNGWLRGKALRQRGFELIGK